MKLAVFYFSIAAYLALSDAVLVRNENCPGDVLEANSTRSRVLSRRKRFLIFPDGSSLQLAHAIKDSEQKKPSIQADGLPDDKWSPLVMNMTNTREFTIFCCQTAALIPIGDIFLFGNTAALAWNLPTDPDLILMLKDHEKIARRGDNLKSIYYVDEEGKLIAKRPFKRPAIVNPVFAKRSVESLSYKEKLKMKIDRAKMHESHKRRHFLKEYLDEKSAEFHRHSRVGLLEKIESLITALGGDGRQCVLRKLCESGKISDTQGTFLQELLRVVFTLPKGKEFELDDHKEYDKAHSHSSDCATLYPCEDLGIPAHL